MNSSIISITIILIIISREFTKGGLVEGGLAIRHVFNLHVKSGT